MAYDDFGGVDIGINPSSIDYNNFGGSLSNDDIWSQIQGGDWSPDSWAQQQPGGGETGPLSTDVTGVEDGDQYIGQAAANPQAEVPEKQNSLLKALGMKATADGTSTDFSDPKSLAALIKALGAGGNFLTQIMSRGKQQNQQSAQQLMRQLQPNPNSTWTPQQQQWSNQYFNQQFVPTDQRSRQYASEMRSPITPSRGYAEGGDVGHQETQGPLSGLVETDGLGQADDVPVNLSGGEYIFDADSVAALGDGNNAAGAKKLDELRQALRAHKRGAGNDEIPPVAKHPQEYLNGN